MDRGGGSPVTPGSGGGVGALLHWIVAVCRGGAVLLVRYEPERVRLLTEKINNRPLIFTQQGLLTI